MTKKANSVKIVIKINLDEGVKMPNTINNILNDFTKKVRELLGDRVKKILLYGSYARRRLQ